MPSPKNIAKIFFAAAAAALLGVGCASAPAVTQKPAPPPAKAAGISDGQLKNMGYPVDGFPGLAAITLKDGASQLPDGGFAKLGDAVARGDFNGDGKEDAAVILYLNSGGTGTWPLAYAVLGGDAPRPVEQKAIAIGDRDQVESMSFADGTLTVGARVHGPDDPACCPSNFSSVPYRWSGDAFVPANGDSSAAQAKAPASDSSDADLTKYVPITKSNVYYGSDGENSPSGIDIYRGGLLIFQMKPKYPADYDRNDIWAKLEYSWPVDLLPVTGGDPSTAASAKPTEFVAVSLQPPEPAVLEEECKKHPGQAWLSIGGKTVIYDIASRSFEVR